MRRAYSSALAAALPLCRVARLFRRFGLVPQTIHLREGSLGGTFGARRQGALDLHKSVLEFSIGAAQRSFRVNVEMAGQVGHGKQEVSDLRRSRSPIIVCKLGFDLVHLFSNLGKYRQWVSPVEANIAGFGLELERADECGEGDRDAGECALGSIGSSPLGFFRLLLCFDALPQALDRVRRETPCIPEHMRM